MSQHLNQSTYAAEQFRAHRAQQNHIKHTPHEKIPVFPADSAEALACQYSKPDATQNLDPARKELAALIKARNEASEVLTAKKAALSKAAASVAKLRADLDAVRRTASASTAAQAAALAACFESGDAPPAPAQPVSTGYADQIQQQLHCVGELPPASLTASGGNRETLAHRHG